LGSLKEWVLGTGLYLLKRESCECRGRGLA
jgi:hypothetical protein